MSDRLKDFFVGVGFKVDAASQRKVEQAVKASETTLTATTMAELKRRQDAETRNLTQRVNAIVSAHGELDAQEKAHADKLMKIHQDLADRDRKLQDGEAKKATERRSAAFKAMQSFALNAAAVAAKAVTALEGTALGITYAVDRTAKKFESLGYMGQRSGSSAKGITAFTYAASQLGATVDEAGSSLERFGDNLKKLPGYQQMLNRLGVRTRDAKGNLRDSADIATDLGAQLRGIRDRDPKLGYARALTFGQTFGLDENTTRALMDPKFRQFEEQRKDEQGKIGLDANGASAGAMAFEQSMRKVQAVIEDVLDRIRASLFDKIGPLLDQFAGWVTQHGKAISDAVGGLAAGVVNLAAAFAKSDVLRGALEGITSGMLAMSKYIASDEFKKDMASLADGIGRLAKAVVTALRFFGLLPSSAQASELPTSGKDDPGYGGLMNAAARGRAGFFNRFNPKAAAFLNRLRGYDNTHVSADGPKGRASGANFTKDNAQAIIDSAKELGTTPQDLATVIGYETGGSYSTSKWGGAGGNYMGLIQFGPSERAQFGAYAGQPFREQMGAVVRYLKGRGFKPGMGLMDLYSTINAGRPGLYGASDGNGTVSSHVANMQGASAAQARALLALANAPATPSVGQQVGAEPKLPPKAMYWATDSKGNRVAVDAQGRAVKADGTPTMASPYGALDMDHFKTKAPVTSASPSSIMFDHSRSRGDTSIVHNPTFNIHGAPSTENALVAARASASRGQVDLLRNIQGAEQ